MEIKLNVSVGVVQDIEEADKVLILGNYKNFTKNKVYDLYLDKHENLVLVNDNYDYDKTPLVNAEENILLAVKVSV